MNRYPIRIDNGHSEVLTFERLIPTADGGRLEGTNEVQPGAGPLMHVHFRQEEGLTVLAGRLGYQIAGGAPQFAGEGESVVFAAGVAHRFWADSERPLRCAAYIQPADNIVFFLSELFRAARDNGGRPDLFTTAFLLHTYRSEFALLEIPDAVQRVLFPVVLLVGRLTGRYRRYRGAPTPVCDGALPAL